MPAHWNTPESRERYAKHTQEIQAHIAKQHRRAVEVPFRDETPMVGPPSCTAADFRQPRLRRCPLDPEDLVFEKRLGGGADGYVWKVRFGDGHGPFALKLFWDFEPPGVMAYYAPQRECQNAALLQMMETAVEQADAASRPIYVFPDPTTREDALLNQQAFCDGARGNQIVPLPAQQDPASAVPSSASATDTPAAAAIFRSITKIPRMKKCHGWVTLKSEMFRGIPPWLKPEVVEIGMKLTRSLQGGKEYTALVYEYVEEGENDPAAVQEVLDFFWLAGFSATISPLARNWKSSVLIDLSDIVPPRGYAWREHFYKPRDAAKVLTTGVGLEDDRRLPPEAVSRTQAEKYGSGGHPPLPPQLPWAVRDRHRFGRPGFPPIHPARDPRPKHLPEPTEGKEQSQAAEPSKATEPSTAPELSKTTEPSDPIKSSGRESPQSTLGTSPDPIPGLMPTRLRPRPGRATGSVPSPAQGGRPSRGKGRGRRRGGKS